MKIEFRRLDGKNKVIKLYVGGEYVCVVGEVSAKLIDWKNASEAQHACREELKKWLNEKPPKPEQLTVSEAWDLNCGPVLPETIEAIVRRTREIVEWEQEHGDE